MERIDCGLGGVEGGDPSVAERGPSRIHLPAAHPRRDYRFAIAVGGLDHRFGHFLGFGHRLGGENDEDTVNLLVLETDVDGVLVSLRRRVTDDVDRVATGPGRRQGLVECSNRFFPQLGKVQSDLGDVIGGEDCWAAGVGDDGDAVARGLVLRRQSPGGCEHLTDRFHPNDT